MTTAIVRSEHLSRLAVIYVRQSSALQVERHEESGRRQYQLTERAETLGWPAPRRLVIDDDQGISGARSDNRPGYQRLISLVALREVGLILGLEVSRLARNCLDWYQLLEIAAAFDVLIADEDGLYDPGDANDRLLLGLKGTFSEVERYQIRARMVRGRLHKAERGALALRLPIGYERELGTEAMRLTPDEGVRHAIERIFALFAQVGSVRGVLRYLRDAGLQLPHRVVRRGLGASIEWQPPSYDALYQVLTNPLYAGVYCFGKRRERVDPLTHARHRERVERAAWAVYLPDHHPGYLSLERFEENMARLRDHRMDLARGAGAPREGSALLQGLAHCRRCGLRMRVRYQRPGVYYCCDRDHRRFGAPICCWASASRVDGLVEELVLGVLNAGALELSLAQDALLHEEQAQRERQQREHLQRLAYQAALARRRYEAVDPTNRLVAQTLETEWNAALEAVAEAQRDDERRQRRQPLLSTREQLQELVANLGRCWHDGTFTAQDKKELLRCVVERIFLERDEKLIHAEVVWHGGARSVLEVPKYLFSPGPLYHRVLALARDHSDAEIARALAAEGLRTVKGRAWTARRVMDFRLSNAIPSGLTASPALRLPEREFLTSAEVGARLGLHQTRIQSWFAWGVLDGKQDGDQGQLWLRWDDATARRLDGSAPSDARMVSVRRLCRERRATPAEVYAWARAQGHAIYRLRRGGGCRFYVLPRQPERRAD